MGSSSKILMSYDFNNNIINNGDEKYSFSQFSGAYNIINGYIGNAIISLDTFNLNIDWKVSFYYQWHENLSKVWNHIFAFGTLNNTVYAFGINNVNVKSIPLYIIQNIDKLEHFYEIVYLHKGATIFIKIDGKFVNTGEYIEFDKEIRGLYLNASYGNPQIIAKIRDFKFEISYDTIEIETQTNTKVNSIITNEINTNTFISIIFTDSVQIPVMQTFSTVTNLQDIISENEESSELLQDILAENKITSSLQDSIFNDLIDSEKQIESNQEYLVNLNFNENKIQDFGILNLSWNTPQQKYFVKDKFDPGNLISKSLYLDGSYSISNNKIYSNFPEIKDFCIEIDFIIDENIKFSTPYSRIYLLSSNINTQGEYHSTLSDIYLLPKYKDEQNDMTLTIESNDLYRNTGNIIYTYGWIRLNKIYSLIYTREGNHFYIIINDKLVYDKTLENTIFYEEGYSKPNKRYFGKNYIMSLELGLGSSVIPTNTQDPFIGYIDKFNISGIAKYNTEGIPKTKIPVTDSEGHTKYYTHVFPYAKSFNLLRTYNPAAILNGKHIILKPYGTFTICGFTIKAGSGGATIIGGPGCGTYGITGGHTGWYGGRIYIYSGSGSVTISGPYKLSSGKYTTKTWTIPGGGYYGIIYYGLVTIFIHRIDLNIYGILRGNIIFVGSGEIYNLYGYRIYGPNGGVIIYKHPEGGWYIGYHKYVVKVIPPSGSITYIPVGYFGILFNGVFYTDVNPVFIKGRGYPLPYWIKICPDPYNYPPDRIQVIEEDILVYVPCHIEEFHDDVIYSKILPRVENYQAVKIRGKFYKDFWREDYGAIGPE